MNLHLSLETVYVSFLYYISMHVVAGLVLRLDVKVTYIVINGLLADSPNCLQCRVSLHLQAGNTKLCTHAW